MPSATPPTPDPSVAYAVVQVDAPEVSDDDWAAEGEDWILTLTCPRCGHHADKLFGPVTLSHFQETGGTDAVMRCNCDDSHAGRESGQGCGAWWGFALQPT